MTFNRYEVLVKHYTEEVSAWNWNKIVSDSLTNCFLDEENNIIASSWLGTPFGIYPSGKVYAFWTSNQTRSDVTKDECFIEALEAVAESHGMFINYEEDIFAQMVLDSPDQVVQYITNDEEEKARELFAQE